jgi:hypothetical protein
MSAFVSRVSPFLTFKDLLKTSQHNSEVLEDVGERPRGLGYGATGNSGTAVLGNGSQPVWSSEGKLLESQHDLQGMK